MTQMIKVTTPCPNRYRGKPDDDFCNGFHYTEVPAAEYYVNLMKSSYYRAPDATGEFTSNALTALLERIVELEQRVAELESGSGTVD